MDCMSDDSNFNYLLLVFIAEQMITFIFINYSLLNYNVLIYCQLVT